MILSWTFRILAIILGIIPLIIAIPCGICFFIAEALEDYFTTKHYSNKDASRLENEIKKYYGK